MRVKETASTKKQYFRKAASGLLLTPRFQPFLAILSFHFDKSIGNPVALNKYVYFHACGSIAMLTTRKDINPIFRQQRLAKHEANPYNLLHLVYPQHLTLILFEPQ